MSTTDINTVRRLPLSAARNIQHRDLVRRFAMREDTHPAVRRGLLALLGRAA